MKLLVCGSFHYYAPWFVTIRHRVREEACDALVLTGNMLNMLMPLHPKSEQVAALKKWIKNMPCVVYYARGWYDPDRLHEWNLPNLRQAGEHIQDGWRIHVAKSFPPVEDIERVSAQTIIVSHFPPSLSRCAVGHDGDDLGSLSVRVAIEDAGDCRLVLCGNVVDPLSRVDWAAGAMVINPALSYHEHRDAPSYALIDTERRTVNLYDGERVVAHSFERGL